MANNYPTREQLMRFYPASLAEEFKEDASKKWQPSNGTEGDLFFSGWCNHCARDKAMSEGKPIEECDDNEKCDILFRSMTYNIEDAEYPQEWQYGKDGHPCCTAFIEVGEPIPPPPDTLTGDLFSEDAK